MGLYMLTNTPSPFIYHKKEEAGRFIPIQIVKSAENQSRFISDIIPLLHLSEPNAKIVKYIIGELVRNVLEHAYADHGAIGAAQYYKKRIMRKLWFCDYVVIML